MSEVQPSPIEEAVRVADGSWRLAHLLRRLLSRLGPDVPQLSDLRETGVRALIELSERLRLPPDNFAVLSVLREPLPWLGREPFHWDHHQLLFEFTNSDGTIRPIDDQVGPAIVSRFGETIVGEGHRLVVEGFRRALADADGEAGRARDYWTRQGPEHLVGAGDAAAALTMLRDADRFVERLRLVGVDRAWPDGIEDEPIEALLERHRVLLRRRPDAWPALLFDDCVARGVLPDEIEKVHGVRATELVLRRAGPGDAGTGPAGVERVGPILGLAVPNLLTCDDRGTQLWDRTYGHVLQQDPGLAGDVAETSSGDRHIVALASGPIDVRSRRGGSQELEGHRGGSLCIAVSPDDIRVVSGGRDRTVAVWDLREPSLVRRFTGHAADVVDVAWSPDGKEVISVSVDGTVRVWGVEDAATDARLVLTADGATPTACHAFGFRLVIGFDDGRVQHWHLERGVLLAEEVAHGAAVRAIASHEGVIIFTASDDRTIRVSAQGAHEPTVLYGHADGVTSLAIVGDHLLSGSRDHTMIAWDLATLAPVRRYGGYGWPRELVERPENFERPTLTLRSGANVVSRADGRVLAHLPEEREFRARSGVSALAETDGRLVVGTDTGAIEVLALPDLAPVASLRGHRRRVNGLALLEDGRLLSWSLDATIRLWDLDEGKLAATTYGTAPFVGLDLDPSDPRRFTAEDADGARWEMAVGPRRENLLLELVGIEDPVPVGTDQVYVVRVTNQGTQSDSDIRVLVKLPPETEYVDDSGATSGAHEGAVVSFRPLPSLAARAMAEWRVVVRARRAGRGTLTAQMTSDALPFRIERHVTTRFSERGEPAP